jgi:phosphoribosyl 1,2-cyclic phosphodiesterase
MFYRVCTANGFRLEPLNIHFLGTGGGRFTMITQLRRTAGIRLVYGDTDIHIDPGPGATVFSNWARLNPQKLDAIVVTHSHPDHYTDAEVLVEAMTHGTKDRRGVLAASRSVLYGNDECEKSISSYHQGMVGSLESLEPGYSFSVNEIDFQAVEARHSDPDTIGLRAEVPGVGSIGYTSDTAFIPSLIENYRGLRLLILCVLRPRGYPLRYHLCTDDVLKVLEGVEPRCTVITHFGMMMLRVEPEVEASYIEDVTGIPTIAARDGMKIVLGEAIEVRGPRKRDEPRLIDA